MALQKIYPISDRTVNWSIIVAATMFDALDDGDITTPDDANYVTSSTDAQTCECDLGPPPANTAQVTAVALKLRCGITDASDNAVILMDLFESDGTTSIGSQQTINTTDIGNNDGTLATVTKNITTLTLSKAEATGMRLKLTLSVP